ncbi:DUF1257 domain-containing protein [Cyanobium sp. FACHB-13342]|uniref:DUF1257 domain-containing protein n=1 Tax=Cyanobium sp. FACHB-13342 TaxID=2692793 RepID=UPI0016818555|nr:DUF1257 domain-containing protein [Cyanobium sp. FACHB-13342]
MSHLSILPTVLRDAEGLAASLNALGHPPTWGGQLDGFAGESQPVVLQVALAGGQRLGWMRHADGSLALVGDLQRLSRSQTLQRLLGRITKRYAAEMALRQATSLGPGAQVSVVV